MVYLRERLKSDLYRRNSHDVTWYGIVRSLSEHVFHVRAIWSDESLHRFAFRDNLGLSLGTRRRLHWLSRQLLNLSMSGRARSSDWKVDSNYVVLIDRLLLFSALSIEIVSLYRSIFRMGSRQGKATGVLPTSGVIRVCAAGYEKIFEPQELADARRACSAPRTNDGDFEVRELSLSQIMLRVMLTFDSSVEGQCFSVDAGAAIGGSVFNELVHACLFRVPRIEEDVGKLIGSVLEALGSNEEMVLPTIGADLQSDLLILADAFERARRCLGVARCLGTANGQKYFPPDIICRSLFKRMIVGKEAALPGLPLTNIMPASKYNCSWDVQSGVVINLVVPDDGLNALLSLLRYGNWFGAKFSYFYSGKVIGVCDLLLAALIFLLAVGCDYEQAILLDHSVERTFLSVGVKVCITIVVALLVKVVVWDIGHWMKPWRLFIMSLRALNDKAVDEVI